MKLSLFNIIMHIIIYLIPNVQQQLRLLVFSAMQKMNVSTLTFLYFPSLLWTDCTSFCPQGQKPRCAMIYANANGKSHFFPKPTEALYSLKYVPASQWFKRKKGFIVENEGRTGGEARSGGPCFRSVFPTEHRKHRGERVHRNKSLKCQDDDS